MQVRSPRRVIAKARRRRQVEIARMRRDPVRFVEYVFGIRLAEVQRQWIRMWQHRRESVLHGAVGLGKSMLARGFVLWLLGNNPGEQIIWLSATQRQPKKHLYSLKTLIEAEGPRSRLHHVFPHLRPGELWRQVEINVDREADPLEADPSISAYGAYSDSILGSRATTLIIDDLCNFTNTLTEDGRTKMIDWLGSVWSRLTKLDVRIIVLGNFWHRHDATSDMVRRRGFAYIKTPAYTVDEDTGERIPTVPEVLDLTGIAAMEKRLGPVQSERMLRCQAAAVEVGRFRSLWFAKALDAGRGCEFRPPRLHGSIFAGVDLGHANKPGSDRTAIVVVLLRPDGIKQIIDVRSGTWTGPQIGREILDVRTRYGAQIAVENNAAQQRVLELVADAYAIPLKEHNTGINKHDKAHGVESLATEVAQGFWVFPCPKHAVLDQAWGMVADGDAGDAGDQPHEEIEALISEALVYDPTKHAGDRLMAWWICSEILRQSAAAMVLGVQAATDVVDLDIYSR